MSYLGKFSEEELELMKRRLLNPLVDEELGINITQVGPLKKLDENDNLMQSIIFNYNNEEEEKGKGRSR